VQTTSRNLIKVTIAGLVVGLSFVGWVAQGSRAQDPASIPQPLPEPAAPASTTAAPVQVAPPSDGPKTKSPTTAEPNVPVADSPPQLTIPTLPAPEADLVPIQSSVPGEAATVVSSPAKPAVVDDPEKAAQAFVQENQKQAESQLKALKDEAERLKARLRKVEAGIARWQSLKDALQKSQAGGSAAEDKGADSPDTVSS
jgi:hypothetical protein